MSKIAMPTVHYAKCDQCLHIAEYYFNDFGATESCDFCQAAPISLDKVRVEAI